MSPDFIDKIRDFCKYFRDLLENGNESQDSQLLNSKIKKAGSLNRWFTEDSILLRLNSIFDFTSTKEFEKAYLRLIPRKPSVKKSIGVSSQENIPLEEFPLLLTILVSGNSFIYKTYQKSDEVLTFFFEKLGIYYPELTDKINFTEGHLKHTDALIFTQKANTNIAIDQYLTGKKALHELRHQSVAVIKENETDETLTKLGDDIFSYFGIGSGNVKKIYIPREFGLKRFFESIEHWNKLLHHNSYMNNYQYSQSVYLLNKLPHLDNGFLLVKEDASFTAPTAVLNYEYYDDWNYILEDLNKNENINTIYVSNPLTSKEKAIGSAVKQLLLPSENLIRFLYE